MQSDLDALLGRLREEVSAAMKQEGLPAAEEMARLATDYRSWARMAHAPARARRIAEQLAFHNRVYADEATLERLSLAVTAMLAELYESRLA
ncbi:hypothetical protein VCB98_00715 [Gammaproteobacteria bacterium AB-CW1]|uniref:Uncharacterized protein n=1 Tax=Natronospira elongata TaxID=3110268 RepID=A0AAP6JCX6_9GAMM|nr:hypothetical protein [Gammaproteobacteria bacterium AB-CW1]